MHLKILSAKRQPFCPGGDELRKFLLTLKFVPLDVTADDLFVFLWQNLQNFMYTMLKDSNTTAAKMSLVSLVWWWYSAELIGPWEICIKF